MVEENAEARADTNSVEVVTGTVPVSAAGEVVEQRIETVDPPDVPSSGERVGARGDQQQQVQCLELGYLRSRIQALDETRGGLPAGSIILRVVEEDARMTTCARQSL